LTFLSFPKTQLNVVKLLDKREKLDFFVPSNASHKVITTKTIKTEVSKQAGTEHRGLGSGAPEIRAWIPPSLRPQHGLSEEAQRDEIFRKVSVCVTHLILIQILIPHFDRFVVY
jgi:hypothetical protein